MGHLKDFEERVAAWPEVSLHSHRFGGREFRFADAELGHLHSDGTLDIPFPRKIHDTLLAAGLAEEHRWVPDSGWITYRFRGEGDLQHGLWLMRLSYLRYSLRRDADAHETLEREVAALALSDQLKSQLEEHLPALTARSLQPR